MQIKSGFYNRVIVGCAAFGSSIVAGPQKEWSGTGFTVGSPAGPDARVDVIRGAV
ncbi:MAG: hypothetical protein KGO50_04270 [Myxococcales bacterium]|nr:hypothetical protein [Myxococcales bacterium]